MESTAYDNQSEVANLLRNIFSGTTENVQIATKTIMELSEQPVLFANALLNIMKNESTDATTENVKKAAATSITRIFMDIIKKNKLSFEERVLISRSTIEAMFSPNTSLQIKVNLQFFLIVMYSVDKGEEIMREGIEIVFDRLKAPQVNFYPAAFFLLTAILNTPLNNQEQVAQCFAQISDILVAAGGGLVTGIVAELESFSKNPQQETLVKISSGAKILLIWAKTIFEFIRLLSAPHKESKLPQAHFLPFIANHEKLAQVLLACLMLNTPGGKQIEDCLVSISGEQELDIPLNQLKMNVLKCFNRCLDPIVMIEVQKHLKGREHFIISNVQTYGLPLVLKTLLLFFKTPDLNIDQVHKSAELAELLGECFILVTRMTIYASLHYLYLEVLKNLIVDVCLPLLKASVEETELFETHPPQFVLYGLDCISKQASQNLKTHAARFLIDLCRFIDGAGTYTANVLFDMIHYSMVPDLPQDLVEHENCHMLTQVDPTIRVETCLMSIGVLYQIFFTRKDIVTRLEEIFEKYQSYFFGPDAHPIIKARLCLVIPFYIGSIFADKAESFIDLLKFILQCAGAEGPGMQTVSEQANDSLYTIFEKDNFVEVLSPFVVQILQELATYIPTTTTLKLFDTIYEMITSFDFQIAKSPEVLLGLVNSLIERGMKEFEYIRANPDYKKIMLNKIWNIIRGIGEQEKYVLQYQEQIEKVLEPMINCLDGNEDIDFDEDILNYIASATKISKRVSPAAWKVFQCSPKIFERYQGMLGHLFPVLNYIIVYGADVINAEPETIRVLVNMGIGALNPTTKSADSANISEGGLFLQLILQYLHPISEDMLADILQATYQKLLNTNQKFLRARFGGVFLCAFMKDFNTTQLILLRLNILADVVDFFLKEVTIFEEQPYDRKLMIIGLSHILTQDNLDQAFENRFAEIFDVVFSVLRYVRYIEQIEANVEDDEEYEEDDEVSMTKQNLLSSFLNLQGKTKVKDFNDYLQNANASQAGHHHHHHHHNHHHDDEDVEEDEDDEAAKMERKEAASTVKGFETELKMKDEFACFKDAANMIKGSRLPFIQDVVAKLPETKKAFLMDVLQSQRIPVDETGPGAARRIVKAGRKKIANIEYEDGNFVSK